MSAARPTPADLARARLLTIPDVIGPGLRALFCGINPGVYSAAVGHQFARPGNRFWKALHMSGFTPHLVSPFDDASILEYGLGITNLVPRTTARAEELSPAELERGGAALVAKVAAHRPRVVAVLGVTAYRLAFGRLEAVVGPQPQTIAGRTTWVLPNPSGLNAHYSLPELARQFRALRRALDRPSHRLRRR